ncbi:4-hydroxythreonine-4-phosphate dehydrogenase [Phialemonium atrogriseum]|uniref:4-hydroxythreonine-4-phosphate dehydrogenase n=1 Tax=Phialemonium atrogriseum TaxID=1093897 RepID=A0AAJ0BRE0_9PEZI|nr:4-hydroxythreonine-4-phosphate dehydrogenase [Phialemonium atrogriseum]KAK1762647.1 4-hydroxythreonine-4-phosphate dehydrogenase [Phialemonium atrogriseum]
MTATHRRPRVALTMGDPAGVGPELAAKLLANRQNLEKADILVLADKSEVAAAARAAGGAALAIAETAGPTGAQILDDGNTAELPAIELGKVSADAGARAMHQLRRALDLARKGEVDAIVFTPLNKTSLKMAGMKEEDELRWFANNLQYEGTTSEINVIDGLWTARVTSHVGIEKVAGLITKETTRDAIVLLHRLLWESGIEHPRLAVCALNPHNGETGLFGRQEIDHIMPGIEAARDLGLGINVEGTFPSDTIFLKRSQFDGIVTMYHDQGQIAMKLIGFDSGVTVQGGLPVVIATPAHGTAFDIVGKGIANVGASQNAFDIAVTMARRRMAAAAARSS